MIGILSFFAKDKEHEIRKNRDINLLHPKGFT